MPVLKSLAFTAMPKTASDPVHIRRAKFIEKLTRLRLRPTRHVKKVAPIGGS